MSLAADESKLGLHTALNRVRARHEPATAALPPSSANPGALESGAASDGGEDAVMEMELEPRFSLGQLGSWGASVGVHILIGFVMLAIPVQQYVMQSQIIDSAFEEPERETDYSFNSAMDQVGSESNLNLSFGGQLAMAERAAPQEEMQQRIEETLIQPDIAVKQIVEEPSTAELTSRINTTGAVESVAGGTAGAVDRLAFEIAAALKRDKVLVIWTFDVSPSLWKQREIIADRVANVYRQLTELNADQDKALKSAVVTFGEKTQILTPDPIDDPDQLTKVVRGIKSESSASGKENTFAAVRQAAQKFSSYRKAGRDVMLIVVTDEAGSDPELLEESLTQIKKWGIRCYCVGEMAPFARRQVDVPFVLEDGTNVIGVMDRGPESIYQETLKLPFWGGNGYDLMNMPSGFGPYALSRLCAETNGLFLITDSSRGVKFDPVVMRGYQPDYRPIPLIKKEMSQNKAKMALVEVSEFTKELNIPTPSLRFRADNDNTLRAELNEAQRPLADFDYQIERMIKPLELAEKERAKITEPRWRASFDLAYGRLLAMRVRSFGYNSLLAEMKVTPKKFQQQGSNLWKLEPSKEITAGVKVKQMAAKASEYLKRVVDEHPGTPWSRLAERELSQPLGWQWVEEHFTPPAMNGGGGGNEKMGPKFEEVEDPKNPGKKVRRMVPDGPQRREI